MPTDEQIQRLAESGDIQAMAQALGIPATVVARDVLNTKLDATFYQYVQFAGSWRKMVGRVPAWVVSWQCQAMPSTRDGFTYIRVQMGLN